MSKVKAAFWGLGATKSIGDSITFYKRKGVQCVREKVTPANPNTAAQQEVRNQFTQGVDRWHDTDMLAVDKLAWNRRATLLPGAMSGFNANVQNVRSYPIANNPALLYDLKMDADAAQVAPKITVNQNGNVTFKIIRGPNAGYSEVNAVVAGVEEIYTSIDINAGSICVFEMTSIGTQGESGYFPAVVIT